jgi:hypothetical protein
MGSSVDHHMELPSNKAKPVVDPDTQFAQWPGLLNEAYTYIHCHVPVSTQEMLIRIWKTTFLTDQVTGFRAGLVHAENITYAPIWTPVPVNQDYMFLLIFEGLPKSCRIFDLVEEIPQPGGFFVGSIYRNSHDIYHVNVM